MLGEAGWPQGSSNETLLHQQTDPDSAIFIRKTRSTDACQEGGIRKKVHSRRKKGVYFLYYKNYFFIYFIFGLNKAMQGDKTQGYLTGKMHPKFGSIRVSICNYTSSCFK